MAGKGTSTSGEKKRKTSGNKKTSTRGKATTTGKKASIKKHKRTAEEMNTYKDKVAFETGISILVFLILSMFFYLSFFGLCGSLGTIISGLCFGMVGWTAWIFPVFITIGYTMNAVNRGKRGNKRKLISFILGLFALSSFLELLFQQEILTEYYTTNKVMHHGYFDCLYRSFKDVAQHGKSSGGILGRAIGDALAHVIGKAGAAALLMAIVLICLYIFYGMEMMASLRKRNAYRQEMEEAYDEICEEEDYQEPSYHMISRKKKADSYPEGDRGAFRPVSLPVTDMERANMGNKKKKTETAAYNPMTGFPEARKETEKMREAMQKKKEEQAEAQMRKEEQQHAKKALDQKAVSSDLEEIQRKSDLPMDAEINTNGFAASHDKAFEEKEKITIGETKEIKKPEALPKEDPISQIPIYREEMNQKFGEAQKPISSFAHKEEITDIRPASQIENEKRMQEKQKESNKTENASEGSSVSDRKQSQSAITPEVEKKVEGKQTAHGKIGGDEYISKSDTFNSLNESKVATEKIPYQFPPIELLSLSKSMKNQTSDEKLRETAAKLQSTLQSFNVNVQMGAVTCGPTVTRFEVLPEQGVRVNKITNLADDLKLCLAAPSIRIEAPIPGKSAVGIEVPNEEPMAVHFRELLEGEAFEKSKSPVTFAVGKDIAGKVIVTDISKMPHLLIAGATGSGKSVCINTLIMSILYKADPNDVKLIMIDPKVVELSCYNGIPHLFCPVVTDPKEAAAALNWAVREMMDRYEKFKELGVRNIEGYNKKIQTVEKSAEAGYAKMPFLVIIVDEFADLMMVASKDVEDAVCRLSQLARAAGIHLILATQRPSVNVITGLIKANIPSRIAFSVSSSIDSRTILDAGGAEKLLGKGDMLFFPTGNSEPERLQGAFVSDSEVAAVVDFLCQNNETPVYNDKVTEIVEEQVAQEKTDEPAKSDVDEYFEDAGKFVIESERAAAGQLQRRFSIGFNRAGRIIDQLHKAGVVGPAVGTKPRQVLMTIEEFEQLLHPEVAAQSEMTDTSEDGTAI